MMQFYVVHFSVYKIAQLVQQYNLLDLITMLGNILIQELQLDGSVHPIMHTEVKATLITQADTLASHIIMHMFGISVVVLMS